MALGDRQHGNTVSTLALCYINILMLSTLSCSYVCSGRNSLGSAEKRVTIHVVGKMKIDTSTEKYIFSNIADEVILSKLSSVQSQ